MVAGRRIELRSGAYETPGLPLTYPAMSWATSFGMKCLSASFWDTVTCSVACNHASSDVLLIAESVVATVLLSTRALLIRVLLVRHSFSLFRDTTCIPTLC